MSQHRKMSKAAAEALIDEAVRQYAHNLGPEGLAALCARARAANQRRRVAAIVGWVAAIVATAAAIGVLAARWAEIAAAPRVSGDDPADVVIVDG